MITYTQATTSEELRQILELQQQNLPRNLTQKEQESDGFVTVEHTFTVLKEMNDECGHIIAKSEGKVVAYALCMHPKFAESIEILKPMFHEINKVVKGNLNYMVMGQICVAKSHRGKGVFRQLYTTMKAKLPSGMDTIITEVAVKNIRSLNAHFAVGFTELKRYSEDNLTEWVLIEFK